MYTYVMYYCFSDDDNRIVLKPLADVSDCQRDYINACYVDVSLFLNLILSILCAFPNSYLQGYSIPNKFIATQGKISSLAIAMYVIDECPL